MKNKNQEQSWEIKYLIFKKRYFNLHSTFWQFNKETTVKRLDTFIKKNITPRNPKSQRRKK